MWLSLLSYLPPPLERLSLSLSLSGCGCRTETSAKIPVAKQTDWKLWNHETAQRSQERDAQKDRERERESGHVCTTASVCMWQRHAWEKGGICACQCGWDWEKTRARQRNPTREGTNHSPWRKTSHTEWIEHRIALVHWRLHRLQISTSVCSACTMHVKLIYQRFPFRSKQSTSWVGKPFSSFLFSFLLLTALNKLSPTASRNNTSEGRD